MQFYIALGIIAFLIVIAVGLHYFGDILSELQEHFIPIIAIIFVLFLGAAIYLSYAVPTLALDDVFSQRDQDMQVIQEQMRGMPLLEE